MREKWSRGLYVLLVLAEVTLCGGKDFEQMFADKSGGETWPCGEETRGDGGGPGSHNGAEGCSIEVLKNV